MSYAERHKLADNMSDVLQQLRRIPPPPNYAIASPTGGLIWDCRIDTEPFGPFATEDEWNERRFHRQLDTIQKQVPEAFATKHSSVFAHSDLYLTNVLVDNGKLSGIVDWEFADFFPEHWECVKARMPWSLTPAVQELFERIWGDKYEHELVAERMMADYQGFQF